MQAGRIPALDGVRGLAILLVLVGHTISPKNLQVGDTIGKFGVSIFFVLSGYLITSVLLRDEYQAGRIRLTRFYVRRAFRILPAFFAFLAALYFLSCAGLLPMPSNVTWAASILYFRNVLGNGWETGHLWSLSLEEQFYLLWPAALILIPKKRGFLVAGSIAAMTTWRFVDKPEIWTLLVRPDLRLDTFLVGGCLALWFEAVSFENMPVACLAAVVVPWTVLSPLWRLTQPFATAGGALLVAILLKWVLLNQRTTPVRCLIHLRPLGVISYSVYLWQQLFLGPHLQWWSWPALVMCATASYHFIEKPFLRLKDRIDSETSVSSVATLTEPS